MAKKQQQTNATYYLVSTVLGGLLLAMIMVKEKRVA